MSEAPPRPAGAPSGGGRGTARPPQRRAATRRRVPVRLQMSNVECGAACLAMVLSHHGRNTRTAEVREECDAGRDGLSGRALARAARSHGLEVRALSVPQALIGEVALPAVAHWQGNHFVVVERVSETRVDVVDPAVGRRTLSREEFADGFTGVLLELWPTPAFEPRKRAESPVWRTLAEHALRIPELKSLLPQIALASVLVAAASLAFPLSMQLLVDRVLPLDRTDLAPVLGLAVVVVALTVLVVTYLRQALLVFAQARLDEQLMTSFFRHMLSLPLRFFQRRSSGDLLMRLTSNAQIRELLASQSTSAVIDGGLASLYLVFLFVQAPVIGAFVAVLGAAHVAFLVATTRYMHTLMRRDLATQATSQGYLVDVVTGIASVKATGAELRVWQDWGVLFRRHLGAVMLRGRLGAAMLAVGRAIHMAVPVAVLWLGWLMVARGTLSLGALLAVAGVTVAFLGPLTSLVTIGQQFQLAGAYAERLADVLQNPPEQADPPARVHAFHGHVEARDVVFRYDLHSAPALEDVSVEIRPGRRVAIVGATGSGKTTLALVLLTLHEPQSGEVRYDGVPVRETNYQLLRRNFGVVLQDTPTLDGTIREILTWQDQDLGEEDIRRAARIACLDEEIAAMPMGYDTRVGERGHALSGGQRQRLAIARAVAHHPRLLVLDEATSHLDAATEAQVARNLRALECTQIVIAHRLSTVVDADEILVMDKGRIRARGTNEELLRTDALYQRLMGAQLYAQGGPGAAPTGRNGAATDTATVDPGRP